MKILLPLFTFFSLFFLRLPAEAAPPGELNPSEERKIFQVKKGYERIREAPDVFFQEAHQLFIAARTLRDTSEMHDALITMGQVYLEKYEPVRAEHYFRHALEFVKDKPQYVCREMESRYYLGLSKYRQNQFNEALEWWFSGKDIVECPRLENQYLLAEAGYELMIGHFTRVRELLLKALNRESLFFDPVTGIKTRTMLGQAYHWMAMYDSAQVYYHDAISLCLEYDLEYLLSEPMVYLGRTHSYLSEFDDATNYMLNALDLAEKYADKDARATAMTHLGILEYIFQNYSQGISYSLTALDLFHETNNLQGIALVHEHLAINYIGRQDMENAEKEVLKSLEIREKMGSLFGMSESYENLAIIYRIRGEYEKALEMNMKSLALRREIGHRQGVSSSLFNIGNTYFSSEKPDSALYYYYQSYDIAKKLRNERGRVAVLKAISESYEKQGDTDKALEVYKRHTALRDSVLSQARVRRIENIKKSSEIKKREQLISDQAQTIDFQQMYLAGFTVLFIIVFILAWRLGLATRRIRRSYKELSQRDSVIHTYSNAVIREKEEAEKQINELEEVLFSLNRTREKVQWLFELNIAGMAVISPDKKWISVNRALADMLGYSRSDLVDFDWESICDPNDLLIERDLFQQILDGAIHEYSMEMKLFRKNRTTLKTSMYFRVFRSMNGDFDYGMCVYQDITYRKFFEHKMLVHQNYLKRFLFLLSTEIEGLINGLRQITSIPNSESAYNEWKNIHKDVMSSLDMIDKIREYQDSFTLEPGERFVNLGEIAQSVSLNYPETSIEISGEGYAFADQSVKYIFDHLIKNAIIHGNAEKIRIQIRKSKEFVQVMIIDNGTGISNEARFQTLDAFLHPDISKFRGIGLYWIRQYMDLFGGGVKIQKGKDGGTEIILLFLSKDSKKVPL